MTAEPLPSNDDSSPLTKILVRLAVIERLMNDHLKYHDDGRSMRTNLKVQALMLAGIVTDIVLHFKGH